MSENQSIIQQLYSSMVTDLFQPLDIKEHTVEKNAEVEKVLQLLGKKRHLWVVDQETTVQLLGIITEADALLLFAPASTSLQPFDKPTLQSFQFGLSITAQDIMSAQPITAELEDTIADVLTKMRQHKIKQLAVLDKNNRLIGEITLNHLIQYHVKNWGALLKP